MHLPRQLRELAGEVNRRFDDVHADCIDKRAAARHKSRHRRFMRPGPGGSPRSCLRAMGDGISMNQLSRAFACLAFLPAFLSPASLTAQAAGDPFSFFEGMTESVGTLKVMMHKPVHTRSVGRGEVERDGSLILVQRVEDEGQAPHMRRWLIRRISAGHFVGSMSEATGPVTIDEVGDRFRFRMRMPGGLSVEQWLTPLPGGRSASSSMTVRKFGIAVASSEGTVRKIS